MDGDDMGDDEREALHGSIRESIEQMKSGQLIDADEVLAGLRVLDCGGDDLDDEERAALHSSIERGLEDVKAGRTVSARDVVEELRARATGR